MAVRIAIIGLGNRAGIYLKYIGEHPAEVALSAVFDLEQSRVEVVADSFGLPSCARFTDEDEFFASARADAVIIAAPDKTHYPFSVRAIERGWHILLEKPVGVSEFECRDLLARAERAGVMVSVCYVMRHHVYFMKLWELSRDPSLGAMRSIRQVENPGIDRSVHSFVRGPWNLAEEGCTMFLAKCCHDVDCLLWIAGGKPVSVTSRGGSFPFIPQNAPSGAADRCVDCPVEASCRYSAVELYRRRGAWTRNFVAEGMAASAAVVENELQTGRYGRCAFRCPNDAIDWQEVSFLLDNGVRACVRLESFNEKDCRETVIEFEGGRIIADQKTILVHHFDDSEDKCFDMSEFQTAPYHAGSDLAVLQAFLSAVASGNSDFLRTALVSAVDSHFICFAAERSRLQNGIPIKIVNFAAGYGSFQTRNT